MKIDKKVAGEILDKIREFTKSLESEYGMKISKSSGTFSDAELKVSVSLKVSEENRDDGVLTIAESKYDLESLIEGLPPRGTVLINELGDKLVPTEWIMKGRKYNILLTRVSDGKLFKSNVSSVLRMQRV